MIAPAYAHLWCRKASVLLDLTDDSQDDGPVAKQPKLEIGPVATQPKLEAPKVESQPSAGSSLGASQALGM